MTAIWAANAVTPAATNRVPVDVSSSGAPSYITGQNIADINTIIGGTVTALGSIGTNTALNLALGGYFSATITGNLTFSITNVPASAGVTFVLALTNGGAFTVTLPGSVTIIGGSPVLSAAGTDWLVFRTLDGGTAWTLEVVGNPRDADLATWATITPGTGVGTALGTNVGAAGSVVTNGGALGTPSSGTLTNCTFPTLNQNTSGYAEALKSATTTVSVSAATAPSSGQVLTATSSTAATWQTPSGGSPGGSDTYVQYNDASAFGGNAGFTYNETNNTINLGGATLTASDPVLDLSQTWNNAAVAFTGFKLNVTSTASAAASNFADFQVAGSSVLGLQKNGTIKMNGSRFYSSGSGAFKAGNGQDSSADGSFAAGRFVTGGNTIAIDDLGFSGIGLASTYSIFWSSTGAWSGTADLYLRRDAANTLAQRNSTTAQTFRVYGTYTDASNYVRGSLAATSTAVTIAAQTAGTGADDVPVVISPAGVSQVEIGNGVQFTEMTAPSAPAANKVILFAQDNGAGKTQLMALFPSGAAQQVSIEP